MQVRQKAFFSLFPLLLSIGTYVFASSQVFVWIIPRIDLTNTYNASSALGAILIGFLSDTFCRKKMLQIVHIAAPLLFTLFYFHPNFYTTALLGLFYNPLSAARAALVDNMQEFSKVQLISLSFMIQFLPECFYHLFTKIPKETAFFWALSAILSSLILGMFLFFDRRDSKIKEESLFSKIHFFAPQAGRKAIFTFIAFVPTQIAYFIADNLLEIFSLNPLYYSILSFGSLLGALLSSLYKKTPHISILTLAYGVALLFSFLPIGAYYFYGYKDLDVPFMFIALGSILGFYISFVYDVLLHSVGKHFRGIVCGILDAVYASASLVTLLAFNALSSSLNLSLVIIALSFVTALFFQRKAEA